MVKPFGVLELSARIRSLLRRAKREEKKDTLTFEDIVVNKKTREVTSEGHLCELTLKEFELLVYLMENQSRVVTRDELLNQVWGYEYDGIDCSQVVTGACAEKMGMTKEQARKMSACFGGGMMCGETCGAVTGALMVLGMVFGHSEENDGDQKGVMAGKVAEFKKRFLEKYPSDMCREILGHDISKPGEMDKVLEKGLMFDLCPQIVLDVLPILEELV